MKAASTQAILILVDGLVIFGTNYGLLYGIGALDGAKRWQVVLSRERDPNVSPPVTSSGQVLVTARSKITAFSASGKQLWDWDTEEDLFYYPAVPLSDGMLAARDTGRNMPSLRTLMHLDMLGTSVKPKSKEYEWPWKSFAKLLDTRKDSSGALWGLISSRAAGSLDDLWIARHDGNSWGEPLFTGVTRKELGNADWFARFVGKPNIALDTDGDGWTDLFERRLGTNPKVPDTDGDGLKDSEDKNPLAAPREVSEAEQVLRAAFQARFQFGGGRPSVCLVELPKGLKPLELYGWGWITISLEAGHKSPLQAFVGKGAGVVAFRPPVYDFAGSAWRGKEGDESILWNSDHTEAKLQIATRFGGLDGTGFDIHLKKFGSDWVVIDSMMVWIS